MSVALPKIPVSAAFLLENDGNRSANHFQRLLQHAQHARDPVRASGPVPVAATSTEQAPCRLAKRCILDDADRAAPQRSGCAETVENCALSLRKIDAGEAAPFTGRAPCGRRVQKLGEFARRSNADHRSACLGRKATTARLCRRWSFAFAHRASSPAELIARIRSFSSAPWMMRPQRRCAAQAHCRRKILKSCVRRARAR